jgi:hypothetical protein
MSPAVEQVAHSIALKSAFEIAGVLCRAPTAREGLHRPRFANEARGFQPRHFIGDEPSLSLTRA